MRQREKEKERGRERERERGEGGRERGNKTTWGRATQGERDERADRRTVRETMVTCIE